MGRIHVLGFDVANLIAAGEVVDRPASVVKELMENALDAEAKQVTVEIRHGGTDFIRVTDDGCGMTPEEMPVAILRHATSKIISAADLDGITTLGFRGEALAATAAVSRMRILSRTADAQMGAVLESLGGENVTLTDSGCAVGTTVIVEDLFFNVPARKKFLKKDATETAAVTSVVEKIALSSPDVSFKYITDGEMRFLTAGNGKLEETIRALYGREVAQRMLWVDRTDKGIRVSGYVSEADFGRANRNMENFFINGRYVKSRTAMAALEQAYLSKMQADKFPFCVLNLEISPRTVDVNVHPSKLEVKFSDERVIFDAVYYTALTALEKSANRPELSLTGKTTVTVAPEKEPERTKVPLPGGKGSAFVTGEEARALFRSFVPSDGKNEYSIPKNGQMKLGHVREPSGRTGGEKTLPERERRAETRESISKRRQETETVRETKAEEKTVPDYTILGEAFNCYVLVQLEDRLLVIDKHAAHERILFDRLVKIREASEKHPQILLVPILLPLTPEEKEALETYRDDVRSLGFEFRNTEKGTEITEIPEQLSREMAEEMIVTFAGRLTEGTTSEKAIRAEYFEHALWQAACKAAIKGGRRYGPEMIRWVVEKTLELPDEGKSVVMTCPHGRPVAFELKKTSLEKQFARIQ